MRVGLLTLLAESPLSSSLKSMRTRRLRQAEDAQLWGAAYDAAVSCVGDREEPPGSHRCDFTEWYGVPGPWCAMFVSWCFVQAGSTASARASLLVRPHLMNDAQRGANSLSITRTPLNADLAVFDLDGDGVPDHIGMFDRWLDAGETRYQTVEGNVSLSGEPNGGGCSSASATGPRRSRSCTCAANCLSRSADKRCGCLTDAPRAAPAKTALFDGARQALRQPLRRPRGTLFPRV